MRDVRERPRLPFDFAQCQPSSDSMSISHRRQQSVRSRFTGIEARLFRRGSASDGVNKMNFGLCPPQEHDPCCKNKIRKGEGEGAVSSRRALSGTHKNHPTTAASGHPLWLNVTQSKPDGGFHLHKFIWLPLNHSRCLACDENQYQLTMNTETKVTCQSARGNSGTRFNSPSNKTKSSPIS